MPLSKCSAIFGQFVVVLSFWLKAMAPVIAHILEYLIFNHSSKTKKSTGSVMFSKYNRKKLASKGHVYQLFLWKANSNLIHQGIVVGEGDS